MKKYLGIVLAAIMFFSLASNAFAESVGQRLDNPEDGWNRIDNTDLSFIYSGGWEHVKDTQNYGHYKGTLSGAVNGKKGDIIFKFEGTKLRVISSVAPTYSKKLAISIDGKIEYYSANKNVSVLVQPNVVVFEKIGLSKGQHEVHIWTVEPSTNSLGYDYRFEGIDIDGEPLKYKVENLTATPGDSKVFLNWDPVNDADGYIIKYGTSPGNYTETVTVSNDVYKNYVVNGLVNGTTYYFVVSAKVGELLSDQSNEASATPQGTVIPEPETGDRAILVVTMTTGLEKEFDLSMTEVNAFIDWYEAKSNGIGSAKFAIDKHGNNKGPFSSRKDYVIFDKILTFEVNEYTTK